MEAAPPSVHIFSVREPTMFHQARNIIFKNIKPALKPVSTELTEHANRIFSGRNDPPVASRPFDGKLIGWNIEKNGRI